MEKPKLTQLTKGSGCGCKIAPADLHDILKHTDWKADENPNLIIGNGANDDAAVYAIENDKCIISTTDFFTPIVDDAHQYGAIAACNAISDVYAMGGKPIMAVGILGWPIEQLGTEMASEVISGAKRVCSEVNIPLAGGHSIDSKEPFFGLAVTGLVSKSGIKTNAGAKVGDLLYLTKPIGTGIAAAGLKKGKLSENHLPELLEVLTKLNSVGEALGKIDGVHAITDVTGFGLLGHLIEMCEASHRSAKLNFSSIPTLSTDVLGELMAQFIMPDNTMRNFKAYGSKCSKLSGNQLQLLCDPQSNGGLLISVKKEDAEQVERLLASEKLYHKSIGEVKQMETDKPLIEIS